MLNTTFAEYAVIGSLGGYTQKETFLARNFCLEKLRDTVEIWSANEIPSIRKRRVPRESWEKRLLRFPGGEASEQEPFLSLFPPFSKESHFAGESRARSRICGFDSDLVDAERSKSVGIRASDRLCRCPRGRRREGQKGEKSERASASLSFRGREPHVQ